MSLQSLLGKPDAVSAQAQLKPNCHFAVKGPADRVF